MYICMFIGFLTFVVATAQIVESFFSLFIGFSRFFVAFRCTFPAYTFLIATDCTVLNVVVYVCVCVCVCVCARASAVFYAL